MTPTYDGPERRSSERARDDEEGWLRRKANENLVLSAIRADEEKDAALAETTERWRKPGKG